MGEAKRRADYEWRGVVFKSDPWPDATPEEVQADIRAMYEKIRTGAMPHVNRTVVVPAALYERAVEWFPDYITVLSEEHIDLGEDE